MQLCVTIGIPVVIVSRDVMPHPHNLICWRFRAIITWVSAALLFMQEEDEEEEQ